MPTDNSPKGLRRSITALEEQFHKLLRDAPWKQHHAGGSPQQAPTNEDDSASGKHPIPSQIPPSPPNSTQTNKPRYKTAQGWKVAFEVIAIPFAIGYAVVTYFQWRDANRNFRIDQRPWLIIETALNEDKPVSPDGTVMQIFESGKPITIPVRIRNAGKLPALGIQGGVLIQITDRDGKTLVLPTGKFTGQSVRPLTAIPKIELEIIFPGGTSSRMDISRYASKDGKNGGPALLTVPEAIELQQGISRIYIVARIDYRDPLGKEHWTTMCKSVWATTESLACERYNATDTNF